MQEIGSYEAKTRLSELLKKVALGEKFIITNHGRAVAKLVPVDRDENRPVDEVIADMQALRRRTRSRALGPHAGARKVNMPKATDQGQA